MGNDFKKMARDAMEQFAIFNKKAQDALSTSLPIASTTGHGQEANRILSSLAPAVKSVISRLEVQPGMDEVKVKFLPGKATQTAYDAIVATVTNLQQQNQLPGKSYKVLAS